MDKKNSILEVSPLFTEMVKEMLHETFAATHHFQALTLEEVGSILEEIPQSEEDNQEVVSDAESFERCKSHYCMLLMELELSGYEKIPPPLCDQNLSQIAGAQLETTHPPSLAADIESENLLGPRFEAGTILTDLTSTNIDPLPNAEPGATEEESSSYNEATNAEPTLLAEGLAPSDQSPEPSRLEETVTEVPIPIETPTHSHIETLPADPYQLGETIGEAQVSNVGPLENETPLSFLNNLLNHPASKNYYKLACFFAEEPGGNKPQITENLSRKFLGQNLCHLVEVEIFYRTSSALAEFWPRKKDSIRKLVQRDQFQLKPEWITTIEKHADMSANYLYEGQFPFASSLASLRYTLLTENLKNFKPNTMEMGCLLYFFGPNLSGDTPSSDKEFNELCFRLTRLERLKSKALDHYSSFDSAHVDQILDDVHSILILAQKFLMVDEGQVQNVA